MEENKTNKETIDLPDNSYDTFYNQNDDPNYAFYDNNENLFSSREIKTKKTLSLFNQIINQYDVDIQQFLKEAPEQSIDLLYKQLKQNLKEFSSTSLSFKQLLPSASGKELSSLLDSINQNFIQYCSKKEGIDLIITLLDKVHPKEEFPFLIRIIQIYINHIKGAISIPNTFDILLFVINKGNNYINEFIYSQLYDYIKEISQNSETFIKLKEGILDKQNSRIESESLQKIKMYIEENNLKNGV